MWLNWSRPERLRRPLLRIAAILPCVWLGKTELLTVKRSAEMPSRHYGPIWRRLCPHQGSASTEDKEWSAWTRSGPQSVPQPKHLATTPRIDARGSQATGASSRPQPIHVLFDFKEAIRSSRKSNVNRCDLGPTSDVTEGVGPTRARWRSKQGSIIEGLTWRGSQGLHRAVTFCATHDFRGRYGADSRRSALGNRTSKHCRQASNRPTFDAYTPACAV
jgi:hypothetical protein